MPGLAHGHRRAAAHIVIAVLVSASATCEKLRTTGKKIFGVK
jgi:predicted phosphoribosyltransferase